MIKFSGLHLHMVLVLAVICVVIYVFYVSRDIVTLDKEVKMLHGKVEQMAARVMQQRPPPQQSGQQMMATQQKVYPNVPRPPMPVAAPMPSSTLAAPACMPQPLAPVVEEASETESYSESETSSANTEEIKEILNEVDDASSSVKDIEVLSTTEAPQEKQDTLSKLSWNEIKEKCRERGIPIKGSNKEQLLAKLAEST